jgi:hypothetical protein
MKITLNLDETKLLLIKHPQLIPFGMGTIDITIDGNCSHPTGMNYVEAICRITNQFPDTSNQKIVAIKELRTLTGIGLAEAKCAVENPTRAINYYIKHGSPLPYAS